VPVLVHPTYGPVVYPFVASASFGPVLRRKQPACQKPRVHRFRRFLIVFVDELPQWHGAGRLLVPALGIFDVEFNELNLRIRSSHPFQRTFAPSRDDLVCLLLKFPYSRTPFEPSLRRCLRFLTPRAQAQQFAKAYAMQHFRTHAIYYRKCHVAPSCVGST